MEGDKGLELSLGLACNHSSPPLKDTSDNSADRRVDTDERTNKILNDFRNFLSAGVPQSFQRTNPVKPEENLSAFQQTASSGNYSANGVGTGYHKRKSTFVGMTSNKKQETETHCSVLLAKEKTPPVSITTSEEESAGGNDDMAESKYPAIKPGVAAEMKLRGSGSFPNLPWVSTTGPGPNGKTISGVTYKYKTNQIKIVCACHGVHLSLDEFVRHATEDQPRSEF